MIKSFPKSLILESENFILRIPKVEDIPHIYSATRYQGFNEGMLWDPPANQEELLISLENNIISWEKGEGYSFTILSKRSNNFLGRISIRSTEGKDIWNVGFWVHPEEQGKGIMTEVLNRILEFGFIELSAKKIEAFYALWNKSSERVLEKNGMKFVRYLKQGYIKKGKWVEENLVAIELDGWKRKVFKR